MIEFTVLRGIETIDQERWNNVVKRVPISSVFHRYEWLASIEEATSLESCHVLARKDGNLIGMCPNFVTSIKKTPFYRIVSGEIGSGGPLIQTDEDEVLPGLLKTLSAASSSSIQHEMNVYDVEFSRYGEPLHNLGYEPCISHCRFVLDLNNSWEEIMGGMDKNRRYNINKAIEQDNEIIEGCSKKELNSFYDAYSATMNRVGGIAQSFEWFQSLIHRMPERVWLFTAVVENDTVGHHFYVADDEQSSFHHMFAGVEAEDFDYYPSELLHRNAIKLARKEGFDSYDFGGTPADFKDGIFKYKEQYGGSIQPIMTWTKPISRTRMRAFQLGRLVFDKYQSLSFVLN